MSPRALVAPLVQTLAAAAVVAVLAGVPSLRAGCASLALTLPALVIAGGVLTSIAVRVRPRLHPSWGASVVDAVGLPVALVLAAVPVLGAWAAARTHGALIGGLLPYSDAADYLAGADRLLSDGTLDEWNSRRPLNATLLAVRLALTAGSLRGALLVQAALLGASALLAARALATGAGRGAGAVLLGAVLVFGGIFAPTTMSECLGLSLGALGFAVLCHSARAPSRARWAAGFALVTSALSARSGPFGVLPMLLAWASVDLTHDGRPRFDRRGLVAGLAGTLGGFTVNALVLRVHHGARSGAQSNFAYTLYGIAHGGVGWERAFADFPTLRGLPDSQAGGYVYTRALAAIRQHPADLALGLWRNVACAVDSVTDNASGGVLAGHPALQWIAALGSACGAAVVTVRMLRRHPGDRARWLPVAGALGMVASVPVIYMDGRERVFAAAFPLGVAWAATLLAGLDTRRDTAAVDADRARAPMALGLSLLVAALVGVSLVRGHRETLTGSARCPAGQVAMTLDGRVLPRVELRAGGGTFAPVESTADFRRGIYRDPNLGTNALATTLAALGPGTEVIAGYDPRTRRMEYLAGGRTEAVPRAVCATALTEGSRRVLRVETVER